jgi:phage tail sheath protein FI
MPWRPFSAIFAISALTVRLGVLQLLSSVKMPDGGDVPEFMAPGVYVEEGGSAPKRIEGVATSTAGFAGLTRYGPVSYPGGPPVTQPRRVNNFDEFKRVFGGLDALHSPTDADRRLPYLAHAARAFFDNGGTALYVSRVFVPRSTGQSPDYGIAHFSIPVGGTRAVWRARWPGKYGNDVSIAVKAVRGPNVAWQPPEHGGAVQARGVQRGSLVEIVPADRPKKDDGTIELAELAQISVDAHDGRQMFSCEGKRLTPSATDVVRHITLTVVITTNDKPVSVYAGLDTHSHAANYIGAVLSRDEPSDSDAIVYFDWDPASASGSDVAAHLMTALLGHGHITLTGGHDGAVPAAADLDGTATGLDTNARGLAAFDEVDEIAVVALPDAGALEGEESGAAAAALLKHVESLRYRIAVLDSPPQSSMDDIRGFRARLNSSYGALYYPWLVVERDVLPPSGFVCGIYARNDVNRGVYKAPADEVVLGATKLETSLNDADSAILNNDGINAIRGFHDRGVLVWGARTLSPDPEWKYVNVRRLFIYLEHSIDNGTQWAVFEPNGERLWANIRRTVENFLFNEWKNGALLGSKPEEAYFVHCDRTTMTQNDLDNGRLVCLVGVAPLRPAEFVIFRIGQWTADAKHV